jgi:hypothetical protein
MEAIRVVRACACARSNRFALVAMSMAVLLAMSVAVVPADAAPPPPSKAALGALELAKHHYKQGHFAKAATLFIEAYGISPNTAFLYNAGRAQQRAVMLDQAEATFRRYLKEELEDQVAIGRARVHLIEIAKLRKHIRGIRKQLSGSSGSGKSAPAPAPDAPVPAPVAPQPAPVKPAASAVTAGDDGHELGSSLTTLKTQAQPSWRPMAAWAGVIGGGAALVLGGVFFTMAEMDTRAVASAEINDGLIESINYKRYQEVEESVAANRLAGGVSAAVGAVALGAGLYLLLSDSKRVAIWASPKPGGGYLQTAWSF